MSEQIGRTRRSRLPEELSLGDVAMAYKKSDTGVLGDAFEWAVWLAIREQDSQLCEAIIRAIRFSVPNFKVSDPSAVMVAAERGMFADALHQAGDGSVLRARRGRPPALGTVFQNATRSNWKADLLFGEVGGTWIPVSLKSNRADLRGVSTEDKSLLHAPRTGITVQRSWPQRPTSPVISFNDHGLPVVEVPASLRCVQGMESLRRVLVEALDRDFAPGAGGDLLIPWHNELLHFLQERITTSVDRVLEDLLEIDPEAGLGPGPVFQQEDDLLWREFDSSEASSQPSAMVLALDPLRIPKRWR